MRVRITRIARAEIGAAIEYLSNYSAKAAKKLSRELLSRRKRLERFPGIGRVREELGPGIRSWTVGEYVHFYRVEDVVEILRFRHSRQSLEGLFDDEKSG